MTDARVLLREAGVQPKKAFGQNFLVADGVTRAIAALCVPDGEDACVIEIGAGLGALTARLAERARVVFAIERDRDLVPLLTRELSSERVHVVEADAKTTDFQELWARGQAGTRVLCGNLPYQLTGPLLQRATELAPMLHRVVFMVQAEVADRLVALPSSKAYGGLSVFVQAAFEVRKRLTVGTGAFYPAPRVTSAVVELLPHCPRKAEESEVFRLLVRRAFGMRRKTLRNAWRGLAESEQRLAEAALEAGVSLDARGETLDVTAFDRMARALNQTFPET